MYDLLQSRTAPQGNPHITLALTSVVNLQGRVWIALTMPRGETRALKETKIEGGK